MLQLRVDVAYLSADLLGGRATGSRFGAASAAYVAARFGQIGLASAGDDGAYLQRFPITVAGHGAAAEAPQLYGANVLAYLDRGAAQTVLIGAHHDHLGFGGVGSLHVGDPRPHNGADDNASGVALMLALARRLSGADTLRTYNFMFAGFDAGDLGKAGSEYLAARWPPGAAPLAAMIDLDMVGRLSNEATLVASGTGTSPAWGPLLQAVTPSRITVRERLSGYGPSDYASFYASGTPVLHFSTGVHPQHRRPTDDAVLINFEGIRTIGDLVFDLVSALPPAGLAFARTEDTPMQPIADFDVTMGLMPDYRFEGGGVRVDRVSADRPAQRAGLQRGDILLEIDGRTVGDVFGYMEALGRYEAGDTVELILERGGQKLRKRLTF